MALKDYQAAATANNLYPTQLKAPSGLGEALKPRVTSIGNTVTIYGSEDEPTGLTLANIATKMALIEDNVEMTALESIPNYLAIVEKSGTPTELVVTSIELGTPTAIS
jgi:hypothetical protein